MNVFLLGRPGCGKSEIWRRLTVRLKEAGLAHLFERIDDFPKLKAKKEEAFQKKDYSRFRPTADGGFKVVDNRVWNELLQEVNQDVWNLRRTWEKERGEGVIAIEFSRPDYRSSLRNFSPEVLHHAVVIYIDAPFDVCWERNMKRVRKMKEQGLDAHFVSREEMEATYAYDDRDELIKESPIPVMVVENYGDKLSELDQQVERIVQKIRNLISERRDGDG